LPRLVDANFDQLWLMAVDVGSGLAPADVNGILEFRESGDGIVTARDHQDLGVSLGKLHSLGTLNHFHSLNLEDVDPRESDDRHNPDISYPNYHSGANGDYQRITPLEPIHDLLRSSSAPNGSSSFIDVRPTAWNRARAWSTRQSAAVLSGPSPAAVQAGRYLPQPVTKSARAGRIEGVVRPAPVTFR